MVQISLRFVHALRPANPNPSFSRSNLPLAITHEARLTSLHATPALHRSLYTLAMAIKSRAYTTPSFPPSLPPPSSCYRFCLKSNGFPLTPPLLPCLRRRSPRFLMVPYYLLLPLVVLWHLSLPSLPLTQNHNLGMLIWWFLRELRCLCHLESLLLGRGLVNNGRLHCHWWIGSAPIQTTLLLRFNGLSQSAN